MFNTDKPINTMGEDLLDRKDFAAQIAKSIVTYSESDNYTIGLYGKWGCGKTSIINMTLCSIEEFNQRNEAHKNIIVINFNPWNFTDSNQLIMQFFVNLSRALSIDNPSQKKSKIGEAIEQYSDALAYTKYIPVIGPYLDIIPTAFKSIGSEMKKDADSKLHDVTCRKSEVEKALISLGRRILIVIDDIDRLPNEQIRLIFQLVNAVAGFPFVTYLLSFDKDVVVRALKDVQQDNGESYLEKIIQVPFEIPPIGDNELSRVIEKKLNDFIGMHPNIDIDNKYLQRIYSNCLRPFIHSLRDVYRLFNVIIFRYGNISGEVDFADFLGITALHVFAPSIYNWIYHNKDQLVGGIPSSGVTTNDVKDNNAKFLDDFKSYYPSNPKHMLNALSTLFPRFNNSVSLLSNFTSENELTRKMRIASTGRFDLCFALTIRDVKIPHEQIVRSVYHSTFDELETFINKLSGKDLVGAYLNELQCYSDQIPESRIEIFINILFGLHTSIKEDSDSSFLFSSHLTANDFIIALLARIPDQQRRFETVFGEFQTINSKNIDAIILLLRNEERAHGHTPEIKRNDIGLFSDDRLALLEQEFIKCITEKATEFDLFECKFASVGLFVCELFNHDVVSDYLNKRFKDAFAVVKYVAVIAVRYTSSDESHPWGYNFTLKKIELYTTVEAIEEKINEARMDARFWLLPIREQQKVAAFVLNYNNHSLNDGFSEIGEKEMDQLLETWQHEYATAIPKKI